MATKKLTRRNFLHTSVERACGYLCLPSLATLLSNGRALATSACPDASLSDAPAFIALDLKGGASIAGNNVIVYQESGELLDNYEGLGLPNDVKPVEGNRIDTSLGLPMHANSAMLKGIKDVATQSEVLAKTTGVVICTKAADDTSNNELSSAPGVFLAGSSGLIAPLVGSEGGSAGSSGGNSITPFAHSTVPVKIINIDSASEIIKHGNVWQQQPKRMQKVIEAINKMSFAQLDRFAQLGMPQQSAEMIKCGYAKAKDLLTPGNIDLDPREDAKVEPLITKFGVEEAALEIAYLVLKGYAGSGTVSLPGYDYHDGTARTADSKDYAAGRTIGMMLQMAASLQRKLMIHVYTDGGVDPTFKETETTAKGQVAKFKWSGDSEVRSAAFVLVYDPSGRPKLNFSDSERQQLGAYQNEDKGTVNLTPAKHTKISSSPRAQAQIVVANWLAWQGQEQKIFTAMPDAPVSASELDAYLFMKSG